VSAFALHAIFVSRCLICHCEHLFELCNALLPQHCLQLLSCGAAVQGACRCAVCGRPSLLSCNGVR
jgi:hypothetical protein